MYRVSISSFSSSNKINAARAFLFILEINFPLLNYKGDCADANVRRFNKRI